MTATAKILRFFKHRSDRIYALTAAILFLKLIIFDIFWCNSTTFTPFSHPELWLSSAVVTMIFMTPLVFFRLWKTEIVIFFLLDILLIANLCYFSTYFNAIPLSSYALIGNLSDFTDSVWSSLSPTYLIFPFLTLLGALFLFFNRKSLNKISASDKIIYADLLFLLFSLLMILQIKDGGFKNRIDRMRKDAYLYGSVVPNFTVFGYLIYDIFNVNPQITESERKEIEQFIAETPDMVTLQVEQPKNVVFILVESLESWVLETTVEGQEITPHLNKILTDTTTLYVPNVLTQVRSGRSIDGQLIYFTGLLPMLSGVYSTEHPGNTFFSLPKALKEKRGTTNYLVTGDKIKTWNQEGVAKAFGIDRFFSRPDFRMEESSGKHKRIGDRALMRQLIEKLKAKELWKDNENCFLQIVTFTSHYPFRIDDSLKSVRFSAAMPEIMRDYLTSVHYTDEALGIILDYLKNRPDYKETMIVIVGDHEGLASSRKSLVESPSGKGVVSPWQLTPLIVVNSPIAGKYTPVIGQVDVYPTLLTLLDLNSYKWHGLGRSIFDPDRAPIAVGSRMNQLSGVPEYRKSSVASGDSTWFSSGFSGNKILQTFDSSNPENVRQLERAKKAHSISDMIITFDFLKDYNN